MILSQSKVIIGMMALSTMISVHGVSKLDEYSAIFWPHYSHDEMREFNTYYQKGMAKKHDICDQCAKLEAEMDANLKVGGDSDEAKTLLSKRGALDPKKKWFEYLPYNEQKEAHEVEGRVAMGIYIAIDEGRVLSSGAHAFIIEYEKEHAKPGNPPSKFVTSYDKNVTTAARKAQGMFVVLVGSGIVVYKFRNEIVTKVRELKKRLMARINCTQKNSQA